MLVTNHSVNSNKQKEEIQDFVIHTINDCLVIRRKNKSARVKLNEMFIMYIYIKPI